MSRSAAGRRPLSRLRAAARLLPLALAGLVAAPALATIEGSPHDLIAQGYDVVKVSLQQERCTRCHISSSALPAFLPAVPPVLERAYGAVSLGCFSCHDGTTIVSPHVDASRTAFHPGSHGTDLSGYEGLRSDAIGLPYLSGARMECVTCHDPHDNGHRPFLRADLQEICLVCHSRYTEFGRGKDNRTGNHILGIDPAAAPRARVPIKLAEAFRTAFPSPYPFEKGKGPGGWHWDLGGHLTLGRSGAIGCITCHTVHGDEAAAPLEHLTTIDPGNDTANRFCEGCHAGSRGDGEHAPPHPNPGGTTTGRTYHAVDDDAANGSGRALEIREPPGWPFGGGAPKRLLCTTCHAPHAAWVETPLLRPPPTAPGFCEECHDQVPEWHHPVGELSDTRCSTQVRAAPYGSSKGLSCASCHQAHNAGFGKTPESDYVPLLVDSIASGALCELCHPSGNPTCSKNTTALASHFVGDPTLADTYDDKEPPLRTEAWPESRLTSTYGGARKQTVICLSCHSFRKGAITSGDDGTARNLLARSGNRIEWEPGQESNYLCTGCHGGNPSTGKKGHTHPLMSANVANLGRDAQAPVTTTPGKVNCDSCHRPHEALTRGGYYILEVIDSQNTDPAKIHPDIDYTVLCHACHDPNKY